MHIAVICTGNICRSPIGEVVYATDLDINGCRVSSAGTANWHVDAPMDHRARAALYRAGYDHPGSLGRFASVDYLATVDLAVAMTRAHRDDLLARRFDLRVVLVRELLGDGALDVADPYYGTDADFDDVVATLRRSVPALRGYLGQGDFGVAPPGA